MAPSRIPYPNHGQGISFFSACYPSDPLAPQTSAAASPPGSAVWETWLASQASLANDRAWVACCDRH
jgi:hypothetical protein